MIQVQKDSDDPKRTMNLTMMMVALLLLMIVMMVMMKTVRMTMVLKTRKPVNSSERNNSKTVHSQNIKIGIRV